MMAKMDRSCIYLVIVSSCFLLTNVSEAKDSLRAGEVLNTGDFLESNNKRFQFSFNRSINPSDSYGLRFFIRCVHNNDSKILWYFDGYGTSSYEEDVAYVRMDKNGELVGRWGGNDSSTINVDQTVMVRNTTATLLDNGNLILVAEGRVLWQSFDHPRNTWFQGMKLGTFGLNTISIRQTLLTSPGPYIDGYYRFGVDPSNPNQLIAMQSGSRKVYWRSGTWNGQNRFLQFLAESSFDVTFTNVFDTKGTNYFTFSSENDPFAFFMLYEDGNIHLSSGNLSAKSEAIIDCNTNAKDGNYQTKGCIFCEKGDEFVEINGTLDAWDNYRYYSSKYEFLDCEELCRNNCSCTAYAYTVDWYDDVHIPRYNCRFSGSRRYVERKQVETFFFRKRLVLDKVAHGPSAMKKVGLSLGAVAAVLVALALLYVFYHLERRNHRFQAISRLIGVQKLKHSYRGDDDSLSFSFASIEVATDEFSDENKLGEGGYGPVYKGVLDNGQEIAVKRLHKITRHGEEQFKNEVAVISKLQHRNLVRLLGYCIHNEERILVYEYLPNNSLDSILFGAKRRTILDWKSRLHIIEGIAQGLLYLHKYSRLKIIHRDLKTSNVLLDTNLNPKISDFGTAKIFGDELFSASTNRIAGTLGYMSPEYADNGIFSTRSDVFSFGVVMLEIISGKKNSAFYDSDCYINLVAYVWDFWINGRVQEITDPNLVEKISNQEVLRYVQVGLLCVQENAADRPTMLAVLSMITNDTLVLPAPKKPGFSAIMGLKNENAFDMPEIFSVNKVTISDVEGR